jgi:hypothetical protein
MIHSSISTVRNACRKWWLLERLRILDPGSMLGQLIYVSSIGMYGRVLVNQDM